MSQTHSFLKPQPRDIAELFEAAIIRRLEKEKRGQGVGKNYKPFLTVRDVPSKGRVHRRPAITHNRIVHLLSDLELSAFLVLDWQKSVVDIREQFPINPEVSIDIARRLGIKHPSHHGTFQIMTTDLLVDLHQNGKRTTQAISVKYAKDLEDERTVEKLEIERRFWEGEGVSWFIFTEHEVPNTALKNIKWLVPHIHSFDLEEIEFRRVFDHIDHELAANPNDKIPISLRRLDERHGLALGTYLRYFRHLAAQNAFRWNIQQQLHSNLTGEDLEVSDFWLAGNIEYVHAK